MSSLQIIIVGAGIAGLATAVSLSQKTQHEILVLETSPVLTEAGAGIQCSATASRILSKWGLRDHFDPVATCPDFTEIRRYENNELLGLIFANVKDYSVRLRGFPHWLVHRVDYQKILADAAVANGVKIQFAQKVIDIDVENIALTVEDGRTLKADLIIGADGIHSRIRRSIPALKDIAPRKSEHYCYRALVSREKMLQNPVTAALIDNQSQQAWAGQYKHIIAYPIARGKYYNLVMTIPDHGEAPVGKYNEPGDVAEMRQEFNDFNTTVKAVLDVIDSCAKWVLAELPPLPTWSSVNGRVILVGDACHAMTPHAASGAATSLEDAEVLGLCVATCKDVDGLPRAAKIMNTSASLVVNGFKKSPKAMLEKQLAEDAPLVAPDEDMTKQFPHPSVVQWLVGHNITEEADAYLRGQL